MTVDQAVKNYWAEGYSAMMDNIPLDACPYPNESWARRRWEFGWTAAYRDEYPNEES